MNIFRRLLVVVVMSLVILSCSPSAGEISGASKGELDRACNALARVGYDHWNLDILAVGGRTLEVAADIHTAHPGPDNTREFCQDR